MLSVAQTLWHWMVRSLMNDKLVGVRKVAVTFYFMALSQHSLVQNEEITKNLSQEDWWPSKDSNWAPSKYVQLLFYDPLVLDLFALTPLANVQTAFLILCCLISGLIPFGCVHSIVLNPTYSIISYGNITFDLCPLFQEQSLGVQERSVTAWAKLPDKNLYANPHNCVSHCI